MDENARDSKGISSREKRRHSMDSGPGEKWGVFNFPLKIIYVYKNKRRLRHILSIRDAEI